MESSVTLNTKIKQLLYPQNYPVVLPDKGMPGQTLLRGQGLARYVVHIQEFETGIDISNQVDLARDTIFKRSRALWLFKEVGACIVFTCKELPTVKKEELVVDRTGFHAVIVQGIHLVAETGEHSYNQSKWFHRTFGKSGDLLEALQRVAI